LAQPAPPAGQWVYTQQYGWIWMPYGSAYTYVAPGYDYPYQYAWQVGIGWTWFAAPWVVGWGPWPFFGVAGAVGFAWYGWGWWRYPYAHFPYRYPYGGYGFRGVPPPYRPGYRYAAPVGGYAPGGHVPAYAPHAAGAVHGGGGHGHR
jgi:hypothetical protein